MIDENYRCPDKTLEEFAQGAGGADILAGRDAALRRLHNDFLREHGLISNSAQADADSKKD